MASSTDAEVASSADLAEVASSADLGGDVTVGVTFLVDPGSVVTTDVAFREQCEDSVMVPSDCVCDYGDYFYDAQYDDDRPDNFDYDDPGNFYSYPGVYGFVEPDNYERSHDLHGLWGYIVYLRVMLVWCHTGVEMRHLWCGLILALL